ncbi:MAG: hypothetical protein U1F43_30340 [Myxococcota bacterium]
MPPTRLALACLLVVAACGRDPSGAPQALGRLHIATAPLQLTTVSDAEYALAVFNGQGDLVWRLDGLRASRYGAASGALSYVGSCDASSDAATNRVELRMTALFDGPDGSHRLPDDGWQNPTAEGPIVRQVECKADADVAVDFDLTILRPAGQGFFDIGVTFADVFCSAKVDCKDALLSDPASGERAATVVMTLACTSGKGEPTWLHYSDVALKCGDVTTWLDPSVGPGQVGGRLPTLFQVATYRGQEALPDLDKCYWNMALGVNLGAAAADCSLTAYATASSAAFDAEGATPPGSVYPYIAFELPLTDDSGHFTCSQHPLNGTPAGVATDYTGELGTRFPYQWECDDATAITTSRVLCSGLSVGATGPATFTQSPGGVTFAVGALKSPLLKLGGERRIGSCCANPCPACQP